ncbi:MAG: glycosyl hydrolase [Dactylosporangium sp.]|nr:glycoside hydrolase family 88 protein [Dactylosporangium sp.]NNJ61491.1 glycosyl hydrolase [Dactylosporangium sp.]
MIDLTEAPSVQDLGPLIQRLWACSAEKIDALEARFDPEAGAPVFTVAGRYTARGWTEWTQGFQFGSALLQFDATGEDRYLALGRARTVELMASHVTHTGVHDHGFNNVSTYGTLLRLMREGRLPDDPWERRFYELALKSSAAVQANRWTELADGGGYIHSFNGPHSLFSDTVRSLRALALGYGLGHVLMGENDRRICLLDRLIRHAGATARYNVYYGEGRDGYDLPGRVVHESLFNVTDGRYRCPSTQQGYSAFSTWTRGLAWVVCGYPEQLEFLDTLADAVFEPHGGRAAVTAMMLRAARATADFYLEQTPTCGVPYWDTGAPGLPALGDYLARPADPFNDHEPVDSSAAAIAAQGLLRLGRRLGTAGEGERYWLAGLRVAGTLLAEPYLSTDPTHEGLLLHSVYHWPNRWDHVPAGRTVACGESSMWGDYHLRELALYLQRSARDQTYLAFHSAVTAPGAEAREGQG